MRVAGYFKRSEINTFVNVKVYLSSSKSPEDTFGAINRMAERERLCSEGEYITSILRKENVLLIRLGKKFQMGLRAEEYDAPLKLQARASRVHELPDNGTVEKEVLALKKLSTVSRRRVQSRAAEPRKLLIRLTK